MFEESKAVLEESLEIVNRTINRVAKIMEGKELPKDVVYTNDAITKVAEQLRVLVELGSELKTYHHRYAPAKSEK